MKRGWNNVHNLQALPNGTFNWLKIYELITYFPFSTRISLYENRNLSLNISMLIPMLSLKNIRMKNTIINFLKKFLLNFSLPPITNLETNFTKSLKRNYPFYPQLTWRKASAREIQHCTLQSPFTFIKKFPGGQNGFKGNRLDQIISEHNNFKRFCWYLTQNILQFSRSSCTLHLTKVGNIIVFRCCLTEGTCIWCCKHM